MPSVQSWVAEHKLASIATVWASAVGASLAYAKKKRSPIKPSLKLIHARMHAQALTLAVLCGGAAMHYLEMESKNVQVSGGGSGVGSSGGHAQGANRDAASYPVSD